ncbi:DUF4129 domain-containing protein [Paenibacillus lignilyticus]|uniref:DUF4129 domain-containing protein n=1 Tax=Paenibacillus lignilyticus TaxID=1172615 RepID=A0ABS5CBH0_9BACL|nr:DUF4129 domain-containing protein [Paenibacillus lignilyticus]MBP3963339.1 DUF4129 domain-containing protein [Paenibacillus lignilyticus]
MSASNAKGNVLQAIFSLLLSGLIELLLFMPIYLAVYVWKPQFGVPLPAMMLLLLAGYVAGCGLNLLVKFAHSFGRGVLAAILAAACCFFLFGLTVDAIVPFLYLTAALFRGSAYAVTHPLLRHLPRTYVMGTSFYFAGSVVYQFKDGFGAYHTFYLIAGLLTLGITLYQTNRSTVSRETLSGDAKPVVDYTVRRHNRLFVGVAAAVSVLIVLSYQLQAVFGALGRGVKDLLGGLLSGSGKESAPPSSGAETQQLPEMPPIDGASKGLPLWVEIILYGIAAIMVGFVLWLLLRKLKELPEWLKQLRSKLAQLFRRDAARTTSGYVDEVERIRSTGNRFTSWRNRAKEQKLKWKDLADNEARVRYLYRRWVGSFVKKGYSFKPHLTPNEINADVQSLSKGIGAVETNPLLAAYQRVRYGKQPISNELLEELIARDGGVKR